MQCSLHGRLICKECNKIDTRIALGYLNFGPLSSRSSQKDVKYGYPFKMRNFC